MFNSYDCNDKKQARPIQELIEAFSQTGTEGVKWLVAKELSFTATEWNAKSEEAAGKIDELPVLPIVGETVDRCPQLGTVLPMTK